jgi:excisionase family DNA binding protein
MEQILASDGAMNMTYGSIYTPKNAKSAHDELDRLLTYAEAAKVLGVCQRTVWQLVRDGELPAVRVRRAIRIRRRSLLAYISAREQQGIGPGADFQSKT